MKALGPSILVTDTSSPFLSPHVTTHTANLASLSFLFPLAGIGPIKIGLGDKQSGRTERRPAGRKGEEEEEGDVPSRLCRLLLSSQMDSAFPDLGQPMGISRQ